MGEEIGQCSKEGNLIERPSACCEKGPMERAFRGGGKMELVKL